MLQTDGMAPELTGQRCEELLVQQFWQHGELADEADVVWLKSGGRWHQLYFDAGMVHWRPLDGPPESRADAEDGVFRYPLVDLGAETRLRGRQIRGLRLRETDDGETLALDFGPAGTLELINRGDGTRVRHRA